MAFEYPVVRPTIPDFDEVETEFREIFASKRLTTSAKTEAFEEKAAQLLDVDFAVAVSSCTVGLVMAMRALDIAGEVIIPSYAFNSCAASVLWAGLKPVLCDCRASTLTLDVGSAEQLIGDDTVAIMPVAVYGMPPDVLEIEALSRLHGMKVICDSAMGLGARYREKYLGGFGDVEVFSLSTKKLVTGVEGGLVTTNSADLAAAIRRMREYGRSSDGEDFVNLGMSARFSELHAVIATHNLSRIESMRVARKAHIRRFRSILNDIPGVGFFHDPPDRESGGLLMLLRVDELRAGVTREDAMRRLSEMGVQTSRYFYPALHQQSMLSGFPCRRASDLSVSERMARQVLAIPLYTEMTENQIDEIAERVRGVFLARTVSRGQSPMPAFAKSHSVVKGKI